MKKINNDISLNYVENSVLSLQKTIFDGKKNILETVIRPNKGEHFVLNFLAMSNERVLPSELSDALQVSTARISALLGALERKKQIVRTIDENNRRKIHVEITDVGRERVEGEMSEIKDAIRQVFIEMGEENTEEFIKLVKQFFKLMSEYI